MAQFHVYHSIGKNRFQEVENQPRVYAGFVEANSVEEAFKYAQNDNVDYEDDILSFDQTRSTSIGDVIQANDGFYMVCGTGFRLLDATGKNDSEINSLESQSYE